MAERQYGLRMDEALLERAHAYGRKHRLSVKALIERGLRMVLDGGDETISTEEESLATRAILLYRKAPDSVEDLIGALERMLETE